MVIVRTFSHTFPKSCYIHLCNSLTIRMSTFQARKKELMGKVSQAEHHVDLLQKEALGNLQLRMDEVGRSVSGLSISGTPVVNSYFTDVMFCFYELLKQSSFGQQRWRSGEHASLPPMWPGFDSSPVSYVG